jgi:hypothetical protein
VPELLDDEREQGAELGIGFDDEDSGHVRVYPTEVSAPLRLR